MNSNLLFSPTAKTPCGIINVDWLAYSVTLCENSTERDRHEWIFKQPSPPYRLVEFTGTNIYKRRMIVYHEDGRKVFTLLCCPFSRAIPRDSALVEVANEYLYKNYWFILDIVNEVHPCVFRCLSRYDLCCDFQCTPAQMELIHNLSTNKAYVQGKRDGSAFHSYTLEGTGVERVPRCLSWGSKNSNIKWKVYNKSAEVFEIDHEGHRICHKPYIVAHWEQQGWDVMNVWRCEVSINPMYKFKFYDRRLTYNDTFNGFLFTDLFISLYMTRFVVRMNEGHKDKSNDTRKYLIDNFGQVERVQHYIPDNPKEKPIVEYASCLQSAMQQVAKPEVQVNPSMLKLWQDTAIQCVKLGNLGSYFLNAYGCKVEDYQFSQL